MAQTSVDNACSKIVEEIQNILQENDGKQSSYQFRLCFTINGKAYLLSQVKTIAERLYRITAENSIHYPYNVNDTPSSDS